MPMIECPSHGLVMCTLCCLHVLERSKAGAACEMDYVFDDFGAGYLFCSKCVAAAREYSRSNQSDRIEAYPIELEGECRTHLQEWSEKVNHVDLNALLEAAEKRTRRRPER